MGVVSINEAIRMAEDAEKDLVCILEFIVYICKQNTNDCGFVMVGLFIILFRMWIRGFYFSEALIFAGNIVSRCRSTCTENNGLQVRKQSFIYFIILLFCI